MTNRDTASLALADLAAAFALLTRLPVAAQGAPSPRAAWAWPVAGAAVGALAALATSAALMLGLPAATAAAVALVTTALLTGGLHEDGLADTADGLMGGRTRERRLEIMKDSRIGSYGTLALLLITLIRWSALTALVTTGHHWAGLIAAGALSRAPMAVLIATLPNARGTGLSQLTGQPPRNAVTAALVIAATFAFLSTGLTLVSMALAAAATTALLARAARARIGGQTGDILGASQQLAEAAALSLAAASLA
ncbi:adenosylcobinamide-GDP ribazoletransferase [Rhodobacteraceae bacterium HSP-20]|uniref:Adenosylcobinamide-GDP ribazoletransferase n=1 Tax=Paragemmobacter amnigenus TaxID=2852097 RepID=A0ABS6IZT2_9RHOB|nr:adenosylcobinamide-GDP ribazoletransferase [Rhodobacter amnigenus]MBU9696802.1 adenosylcobinamide-GDP ribazoletransferase [Rhodobacter amnigenus]MBV4388029.1 adenosylcobinamide-GDP ribazoletransferase [Rhodobacter amnigenus]